MAKLKIRSHYASLAKSPTNYEKNEGFSETVQGEARTIAELLQSEMQGMQQTRKKVAFLDAEDIDNINKFYRPITDLTDLDDFKSYTADLQSKIKSFEAERAEKERQIKDELKNPPSKPVENGD